MEFTRMQLQRATIVAQVETQTSLLVKNASPTLDLRMILPHSSKNSQPVCICIISTHLFYNGFMVYGDLSKGMKNIIRKLESRRRMLLQEIAIITLKHNLD